MNWTSAFVFEWAEARTLHVLKPRTTVAQKSKTQMRTTIFSYLLRATGSAQSATPGVRVWPRWFQLIGCGVHLIGAQRCFQGGDGHICFTTIRHTAGWRNPFILAHWHTWMSFIHNQELDYEWKCFLPHATHVTRLSEARPRVTWGKWESKSEIKRSSSESHGRPLPTFHALLKKLLENRKVKVLIKLVDKLHEIEEPHWHLCHIRNRKISALLSAGVALMLCLSDGTVVVYLALILKEGKRS